MNQNDQIDLIDLGINSDHELDESDIDSMGYNSDTFKPFNESELDFEYAYITELD